MDCKCLHDCRHESLNYCDKCGKVHCLKCGREWPQYEYSQPYIPYAPYYPPYVGEPYYPFPNTSGSIIYPGAWSQLPGEAQ